MQEASLSILAISVILASASLPRLSQDLKDLRESPQAMCHFRSLLIRGLLTIQQFAARFNHGFRREAELLEQLF
jgi:hypothetical protein